MEKIVDFIKVYRTLYRCTTWQAVKAFISLDRDFRKYLMEV